MNEEQFENINYGLDGVLGWVSNWWNGRSYTKSLYTPLSKMMSEYEMQRLDNHICNHIWPELEIDFADRIMAYIQANLVESDEL